jgi:intergrase/recombinase
MFVSKFYDYCYVDERLEPRVSKDYRNIVRRFLKHSESVVSEESIRSYLSAYLGKAPKTYNNQLDGLRAFIVRYLKRPDLMDGFKKAHVNNNFDVELPTEAQIQKGFEGLTDDRERAIYLFYATTGLRNSEVLKLNQFEDIDYELRAVKSKHDTRTKKAGVTFYNEECETWLKKYLNSRKDNSERLFCIGWREFLSVWKKASEKAEVKIRPQILRKWHSTQLGELGVPDRYVDVFQGRAPRSVLARHYTGKGLETLKRIYQKAGLKVLS